MRRRAPARRIIRPLSQRLNDMSVNAFGHLFRMTTWGESHGPAIGAVVDGCPPGLALSDADIQPWLDRRRPGASTLTSPRREADRVRILSGVYDGRTTGTPISLVIDNVDARPKDYAGLPPRAGHADAAYDAKYGLRDPRGGGRASARETAARVAAGAVARLVIAEVTIAARVIEIGGEADAAAVLHGEARPCVAQVAGAEGAIGADLPGEQAVGQEVDEERSPTCGRGDEPCRDHHPRDGEAGGHRPPSQTPCGGEDGPSQCGPVVVWVDLPEQSPNQEGVDGAEDHVPRLSSPPEPSTHRSRHDTNGDDGDVGPVPCVQWAPKVRSEVHRYPDCAF